MKNLIPLFICLWMLSLQSLAQTSTPYSIDQIRPSNFTIWATGSTVDNGYALYQTDTRNQWVVVSNAVKSPPRRLATYSYDHAAIIENSGQVRYVFKSGGGRWVSYIIKSATNAKDISYAAYPSSGNRPFYILGTCTVNGSSQRGIFKKTGQHDVQLIHSDATAQGMQKIAVDSKEVIYGITSNGSLVYSNNGSWSSISTSGVKAKDIHFEYDQSNGPNTLYIQATDGQIYKKSGAGFKALPMDGTSFGCTSNGKLYACTSSREVLILEKDGRHYGKKLTVPKAAPTPQSNTASNNRPSNNRPSSSRPAPSISRAPTTSNTGSWQTNTKKSALLSKSAPINTSPRNLKQAVATGDRNAAAQFMLTEDVNQTDNQGNTLLKSAVDAGDYNMAKMLLDKGANQNTSQPIVSAVEQGNTQMVSLLAERRADLTPGLNKAVEMNDAQLFKLMVNKGGRANDQMMRKAMDNNNADIVAATLNKGVSPATAMTYAQRRGDDNMILLAVDHGAKPEYAYNYAIDRNNTYLAQNLLQSRGSNPNQFLTMAFKKNNLQMSEIALQKGANANNAINGAVQRKNMDQLDLLLRYRANPDQIFTTALQKNDIEISSYAVNNGARVNGKNFKMACTNGNMDLVHLMVSKGANPNEGISEAIAKNHTDLAFYLLDAGADGSNPKLLLSAAGLNNVALVNHFLDIGQNPQDAMMVSIKRNHLGMVKLLVERGANPKDANLLGEALINRKIDISNFLLDQDAPTDYLSSSSENLVHLAVATGDLPLTKRIIELGVAVNAKDRSGNTPMHTAVKNKRNLMIGLLTEKEGEINPRNNKGETPLHLAVREKNNTSMITVLATAGADLNARNNAGKVILKTAKGSKNKKLLKSLGASK